MLISIFAGLLLIGAILIKAGVYCWDNCGKREKGNIFKNGVLVAGSGLLLMISSLGVLIYN